ncbi:MAG TPA: hypothetical protein ENH86_00650 [Candidatus Jorgensenbacteria bacterium]|nr:hypothetical protein [Candidatus Jorgensenbacteria bacterium]
MRHYCFGMDEKHYVTLLHERDECLKKDIPGSLDLSIGLKSFPTKPAKDWIPRIHLTEVVRANFRRAAIQMKTFRKHFNEYLVVDDDPVESQKTDNYICFCIAMYFFGTAALKAAKRLCEITECPSKELTQELSNHRQRYRSWTIRFAGFRNKIGAHGYDPVRGGHEYSSVGSDGVFAFYTYSMKTLKPDKRLEIVPEIDFFKLEEYLNGLFKILYNVWDIKP